MVLTQVTFETQELPNKYWGTIRELLNQRFTKAIKSLTIADIDRGNEYWEEIVGLTDAEYMDDYKLLEAKKTLLRQTYEAIISNESTWTSGNTYTTISTGGLSDGGDPTEAIKYLENLQMCPEKLRKILGVIEMEETALPEYLAQNPDMPENLRKDILKYEEAKKI